MFWGPWISCDFNIQECGTKTVCSPQIHQHGKFLKQDHLDPSELGSGTGLESWQLWEVREHSEGDCWPCQLKAKSFSVFFFLSGYWKLFFFQNWKLLINPQEVINPNLPSSFDYGRGLVKTQPTASLPHSLIFCSSPADELNEMQEEPHSHGVRVLDGG